jgi:hypothetical protein
VSEGVLVALAGLLTVAIPTTHLMRAHAWWTRAALSRALLAPQEVQQLVVDVPGALLLRPVAAVGQQDDPA